MAIISYIFAIWREPRRVFSAKVAEGPREDRALLLLMVACFLLFVARWPVLARDAHLREISSGSGAPPLGEVAPLDAQMEIIFFISIFVLPLLFYLLAAVSVLVMRAIRRPIAGFAARLALIWSLLAITPFALLRGLLVGFAGQNFLALALGVAIAAAFLWLWITLLAEGHRRTSSQTATP